MNARAGSPDWWTKGYPGGPMVAVAGFPRPLYSPDSVGHKPSSDGSDVEAYKRTVSRLGRWEWQRFDQAYSNAFAHGKSGNVHETGVAGFQRQQGIEATGQIGKETFNALRSARIPEGLPHAGEPGMDARSVELINAAWERFQGDPKPEPPAGTSAQARLAQAQSQLGVKEKPPNSNQCLYTDWYGMVGPWCAMFSAWSDQTSVRPSESFTQGAAYAYVPYLVQDARLGLYGLTVTSSPKPGDLVAYDWSWDGEYDHVGIVETPPDASGDMVCIEGNTSPDGSSGSQSNGGEVCRRHRNIYGQATVFIRVDEP